MRRVRAHAFASTKGGVGKSSLAVATARYLAHTSRVPVVLDLDLTGSSTADALALCAPDLPVDSDGRFSATGRMVGWLDHASTQARRQARGSHQSVGRPFLHLPYSNDALLSREAVG